MAKRDRTRARVLGALGEDIATSFFKDRGYDILERNYRVPVGEIDLICKKGDLIVFVEVKTRSTNGFGGIKEAITPWKIERIKKAAMWYIMKEGEMGYDYRFDCVFIVKDGDRVDIEHIAAAFGS